MPLTVPRPSSVMVTNLPSSRRGAMTWGRCLLLHEMNSMSLNSGRTLPLSSILLLPSRTALLLLGLGLIAREPRCTLCNGELARVERAEVADIVPARSLIWAREFYRCNLCGHVF